MVIQINQLEKNAQVCLLETASSLLKSPLAD